MTSWIGRVILFPSVVRSTTVRIFPSRPFTNCSKWALFHIWRGRTSCSRATSPIPNFGDACCCQTSWKLLRVVRYSLCHHLQRLSTSFCRILNSFVRLPFISGSGPVGIAVSLSLTRKCAVVNAPDSSSVCTMGLELMAASVATRMVFSPSETWNRPSTLCRQGFVVPTILFHHPPHQATLGAINFQLILLWARNWWVLAANREVHSWDKCLFVAWNVCALSEYRVCGSPRLPTNLWNASKNLSVVISVHNSKWTARVVARVKRAV